MQIRAVIFDLDGTLVDSNERHVVAWAQAFRQAGRPVEASAIRGQIGKGADKLVPALLPDADDAMADRLGKRHGAIFKADHLAAVEPFPHAHALLARVQASKRKVVIASSASQEELEHYLQLLDAVGLVAASTSIDDVADSKPDPAVFAVALKKLGGVAPAAAIAVGDSPYDIEGAYRTGSGTVAVRSGGFSDDALAEAVALYDDAAALLAGFDASPLAR